MKTDEMIRALKYSSQIYNGCVPFCGGQTHEWHDSRTEYCVNTNNKNVTVVFRGTDSKHDWKSNLAFCKKTVPYGNYSSDIRVHTGFINTYKAHGVRDRIHSLIPDEPCRITVTGHSRGAALAVLCAVDLQYNFPGKSVEAYLFGCPRVGNAAFAKSYNKRVFKTVRVENGNDIVTKVPPAFFGYRHVGARFRIGNTRLPFAVTLQSHYPTSYFEKLLCSLK